MSILDLELSKLRDSASFISLYQRGMGALYDSGIFNFLREKGKARIPSDGGTNIQMLATQAARSAGYNEALDDLFYFVQIHFEDKSPKQPDISLVGVEMALAKGDITEEEADAIRDGRDPDYSKYTRAKDSSTAG